MISDRLNLGTKTFASALLCASMLTLSVGEASALDPKVSTQVSDVTFTSLPYYYSIDGADALMGIEDCEDAMINDMVVSVLFTATFDMSTNRSSGTFQAYLENFYTFELEGGSGSSPTCGSGNATCNELSDSDVNFNATEATPSIDFDELTGLTSSEECGTLGLDREYFIRANIYDANEQYQPADARIVLDTVRPSAPTSFTAIATEDTIQITWVGTETADLGGYRVIYSTTAFSGGTFPDEILANDATAQRRDITVGSSDVTTDSVSVSLTPGTQVYIGLATIDEVGNPSEIIGPEVVEVVDTVDFWEDYKGRGGSETGGYCSSVSATKQAPSPLPLTGFLLFIGGAMLMRRRRNHSPRNAASKRSAATAASVASALALLTLATSGEAQAQEVDSQTDVKGSFEFKIGGFYPGQIDAETGGADGTGSFESFYGSDNLVYGEFVYERYLFKRFGKLGLGFHAGYTSKKGEVQSDTTSEDEVPGETTFRMIPFRGSLFYRYDYSALHHRIPLAPIARVGVDYVLWRVLDSDGEVSDVDGQSARGGKMGWHASLGMQFMLDYLDPGSAASFDLNWGINNSYLFAEYMITRIDDFGGSGFDLSDNLWMFGLAFEY